MGRNRITKRIIIIMKLCRPKFLRRYLPVLVLLFSFGIFLNTAKASFDKLKDVWNFNTNLYSTNNNWLWDSGTYGGIGPFSGSSSYYGGVGTVLNAPINQSHGGNLAYSFWSYGSGSTSRYNAIILNSGSEELQFRLINGNHDIETTYSNCASFVKYTSQTNFFDVGWNFFAINVFNNKFDIYYNGELAYTCNFTTNLTISQITNLKVYEEISPTYMADVAIYDTDLTTTEISEIYNLESSVINYTPAATGIIEGQFGSNGGLFFFSNPYSCNYNSTCKIDYSYNTDIFTPYDYINIYSYPTPTSTTATFVASTTIENLSVFGKSGGQSFFTLTKASSNQEYSYYDITAVMSEYWDAVTATTVPATTSIPYSVIVDWGNYQFVPTYEKGLIDINSTSTSSKNNLLNLNTRSIACTEDEWNSTSSIPIIGWNVDKTVCRTKKWILDIALVPGLWVSDAIKSTGKELSNMFPFGLIISIKKCWNNSATESLPEDLIWVTGEIDSEGNIKLNNPEIEGIATSSLVVFGPDLGTGAENYAAKIRSLSKYLMIAIFFWFSIYKRGIRIYNEFKEEI